jgi:hypothetical protein
MSRFSPSIQVCNRDGNDARIWSLNGDFLHHILVEGQTKFISEVFWFGKFRMASSADASVQITIHNRQQRISTGTKPFALVPLYMHLPTTELLEHIIYMRRMQIH